MFVGARLCISAVSIVPPPLGRAFIWLMHIDHLHYIHTCYASFIVIIVIMYCGLDLNKLINC